MSFNFCCYCLKVIKPTAVHYRSKSTLQTHLNPSHCSRHASQPAGGLYTSQAQAGEQPGPARGMQTAQKRPWKPSMGLVPSSQAGSMPPRPVPAAGARRLARPVENHLQGPSQPRMTISQPNSFQEYAPSGTPGRQYIMPADHRQPQTGSAAFSMPSSQPSSGMTKASACKA